MRGLLGTSVFIASECGRVLDTAALPDEGLISVLTSAELQVGVLAAQDTATRARRLSTLGSIAHLEPLPIDQAVAARRGRASGGARPGGQKLKVNALWFAATAAANDLPVVTRDAGFEAIEGLGGPRVIRV